MNYTTDNVTINREHKDRLFCLLFGDETNKANILSLYNALNNSNYTNEADVELTTLNDTVYIHMKNDVSFLIDSWLTLWEQQSSLNPNMPVRGLMYYGNLYNSYIKNHGLNIYKSKLVKIPTPQYVVFYTGNDTKNAITKLYLSDAFMHEDNKHEFEWTATMLDLNHKKNKELLSKCKVLSDYMTLINKIKHYTKQKPTLFEAIETAVNECIREGILTDFLRKHRSEVMGTCLTEFDEELYRKDLIEEGREEGHKEGLKEGLEKAKQTVIINMLRLNKSIDDICTCVECDEDYIYKIKAETQDTFELHNTDKKDNADLS